jgi:peptide deformylase
MIRLVKANEPMLRAVAEPIAEITLEVRELASIMPRLMEGTNPRCVGLAAPQIGHSIRLIAIALVGFHEVMINPEIVYTGGIAIDMTERCLSLPGAAVKISRPDFITVKWQRLNGKQKMETFCGMESRVIQHEVDHLNGILITDHK